MNRHLHVLCILGLACVAGEVLGQEIRYSPDEIYLAKITKAVSAGRTGEVNRLEVEVFDSLERTQYSVVLDAPFDVPYPDVYVTDAGQVVLVNSFYGTAEFYGGGGNLERTIDFFKEEGPVYERIVQASVAGEVVAFLMSDPFSTNAELIVYDLDGTLLWRQRFSEPFAYRVEVLPKAASMNNNERVIAASRYDFRVGDRATLSTSVIDLNGRVKRNIPLLFRHADYANTAKVLALADQSTVVALGTDSLVQTWSWKIPGAEEGRVIAAVATAEDGMVVVQTALVTMGEGVSTYGAPAILFFDGDGSLVERQILEDIDFNRTRMRVELKEVSVKFDGEREVRLRLTQ